jgi:hypothetical protein
MVVKDATSEVTELELTRAELEKLIDCEARATLNISGEEFREQYACGKLSEDDPRVRVLASLLKLAA